MKTATSIRADIRAAAMKALDVANDDRMSQAQKRQHLGKLNVEMKSLTDELTAAEKGGPFNLSALGDTFPDASQFVTKAFGIPAPSLDVADETYAALFEAASSNKALTITADELTAANLKTVDSTAAPMSAVAHYNLPPVPYSREKTRVLDLIPTTGTSARKEITYRYTTGATAASVVSEGGTKPQSNLVYEAVEAPVQKIAHWIEVTDEALQDFTAFQGVVATEMSAGVIGAENHQLLVGTGISPDLPGILSTSGILTRAKGGDTRLDAIAKGMNDLRIGTGFAEADAIVMHPSDYLDAILEKSTTNEYLATNPLSDPSRSLWGLPVTLTTDMTEGTAVIACFKEAARAWVRQGLTLTVNPWAETQFKSNKVLILAEERIAFVVEKPTAVLKLTGF